MATTQTLARLTDVAQREALPLAVELWHKVRGTLDKVGGLMLDGDLEDRLRRASAARGGHADPFGLDIEYAKYAAAFAAFLKRHYFRADIQGLEHVPKGRALLVANHSGQVPIDGIMIAISILLEAEPPRLVRAMVEKWSQTLPFVSTFFSRTGQVVGVPENAIRLLEMEEALLVFPEGTRGLSKTFRHRYQLTDFGLGFMRLALEARAPVVPVAVIGAEEQYISIGNVRSLAKLLHTPAFPILPQLFLPGGQLPLPTKYRIYVGEPIQFEGDPDDDDSVIEEKVWVVKATIQSMINKGLRARRTIFF